MQIRLIYFAIVVATTVWVGIDASNLGVRRGRLGGGLIDMSTASWVICCLFLWIVSFPCYLVARGKDQTLNRTPQMPTLPGQLPSAWRPGYDGRSVQPAVMLSPDGRWWWDGQRWQPMAASPAPDAWGR
jgi:hypothetical protein